MKAANQIKLTEKYKEFFNYLNEQETPMLDPNEPLPESINRLFKQEHTVVPMQFGFECGDGWYWILDKLMGTIQFHIEQENHNRDREPKIKWLDKLSWKLRIKTSAKQKLLRKIGEWLWSKQPRGVPHMDFRVTQIKEKFGGLRFYYNGGDKFIDGAVSLSETMSYHTCEICGTTEHVGQTSGWVYTICYKCREKNPKIKNLKWKGVDDEIS